MVGCRRRSLMLVRVGLAAGSLLGLLFGPVGAARATTNTDEVVFKNGDRLTGEIKKLDRGKLSFKTDPADTISIEWMDVARLTSPERLEVETSSGARYFGELKQSPDPGLLRVEGYDTSIAVPILDVVRITPIKDRILSRIDGLINMGYTFAQATDITTFTFSASTTYRVPKYLLGMDLSTNLTDQESGSSTREDLSFRFQYFLKNRWFTNWETEGERNDELGIDLRTILSGTSGRNVIQSNHVILAMAGGLSYNRERLIDETGGPSDTQDSLEALGTLRWEVFRDRNPKTDLICRLTVYPSLTESGRFRGDADITLQHELFKDFTWQLRLKESYDNRPTSEDIPESDFYADTSFGWSF